VLVLTEIMLPDLCGQLFNHRKFLHCDILLSPSYNLSLVILIYILSSYIAPQSRLDYRWHCALYKFTYLLTYFFP